MDPSSGMGGGEFGQMGDPTQYLTPNDLISQRSSPDFMPGGTILLSFWFYFLNFVLFLCVFVIIETHQWNYLFFFFWKMTRSKQYLIYYFCICFGIQVRVTLLSISKWTKVSSGDFSQFICGREGVRIGLRSRRRPCRLSMTRCVEKRTEKRYKTREWKDSFVLLCLCRWCYTVL